MANINPDFAIELKKYGSVNFNACYNCGTCTAVCSLSTENESFPRKMVRASVLGLEKDIQASVDPWLCYYCGECSSSCPRDANPGELMMILRRYLTASYDWTGLSRKFYTSKTIELAALSLISVFVLVLFILFAGPMETELTTQGGVKLNTFAPAEWVHFADSIMAGVLAFFLLSNAFVMYMKIMNNVKVPFKLYFTHLWELIFHFGTQWKFKESNDTTKIGKKVFKISPFWVAHWFLMSSYILLFGMIVLFLDWFQTDLIHPWWHPQRLFGYYATIGLSGGLMFFFIGRFKKHKENNKFSHYTDWTFLILLSLTVFTGILVHFFRIGGLPYATYYTYVIHLMVLVPMLMIEVPFSKWSHLAYRPLAIYFSSLKQAAIAKQN